MSIDDHFGILENMEEIDVLIERTLNTRAQVRRYAGNQEVRAENEDRLNRRLARLEFLKNQISRSAESAPAH